ncbi:hypothetical protein UFOVP250_109 [uncultured Caudovirales phage]|uniref:Uncharacterized protein n=1 Tax=uncultured Caudovirales phage TaxID=2100421 RepID=A0A6J5LJ12_9CAUD|nr:hypothetical protein UFOVP250_109 [uncultured Caudovirales phage]
MELVQSKSLLAKLMATENLIVEQRNVSTASFDVKQRILTIPVLDQNISSFLYDLFVGHEVGHALYTPLDGLYKARDMKISMSVMNVLEDVRIERKIKYKYPGIRTSFVRGYKELIEKDFFGTKGADLNDLNFIDRINMHSKAGAACGIRFNDEEKVLLKEAETTETYDDVIEVAKKVMEYLKKEKEENQKLNPEETAYSDEDLEDELWDDIDGQDGFGDEDDDSGTTDEEDVEGGDDEFDDDETPSKGDVEEGDSDWPDDLEQETDKETSSGDDGEQDDEFKSLTDEEFHKNEKKLFEESSKNYYYGNIPDVSLSEVIVGHKELWNRHKSYEHNEFRDENVGIDLDGFQKIRKDANKVVSYLAREFEMKKNADQMKKATIAKSGDLNMEKIFSYKFNEDVFKKITVVPGGKSHGLVMFLDWSGSMSKHLLATIKQLINLVMFCKKVNIPYEVYAFSSYYDRPNRQPFKEGDIRLKDFKLMNILSHTMNSVQFTYAASALVSLAKGRETRPPFFYLGITPLSETIIAAMKIIPEFQKNNNLQIVNTVFLTDGDGHNLTEVGYKYQDSWSRWTDAYGRQNTNSEPDSYKQDKMFVIRDPITKNQEINSPYANKKIQASYFKLLKDRTGCNIVGFYVLSGRDFNRSSTEFFPITANHEKLKAEFRKNKYQIATSSGYDEFYLLKSESLDTDTDVEFKVRENATTRGLVSAFSKYTGNRLSNRVVLNRFMDLIT